MEGAYSSRHAVVYDFFLPDRKEEIVFWEKIARSHGRKILDVMAGTGEVAHELVKKGFKVTGIDMSREMLRIAKKRQMELKREEAKRFRLLEFDVLNLNLHEEKFDFAYVIGSSFNLFLYHAHQKQCLANIWKHLASGGGVGIEVLNPVFLKEETSWQNFEPTRKLPPGLRAFKAAKETFNKNTGVQHINQRFEIMMGEDKFILNYEMDLKHFNEEELRELLLDAGFEEIVVYGNYKGEKFLPASPRIIMTAKKI